MIIYQDDSVEVTISAENTAVLNIAAFTINGTRVPAQSFDLTAFQGKAFRLYVEENGDLSTDAGKDHFWLLLEAVLPERKMECSFADDGSMQFVDVPLDLNNVNIGIYALPKVEVAE